MRSGRVLGVIPARLASERLHQKPLHRLVDRPLIEWVWRRAESLQLFDQLIIATDSDEIMRAAESFGAKALLTSPKHSSGTERIAEVVASNGFGELACVVNIQGDEPFVTREQIEPVIALILDGWPIASCATPVGSIEAWRSPSVVKVVRGEDGRALYFSRAPIPYTRDREPSADDLRSERYLRHIGVYAYRPVALKQWVNLPPHSLEQAEKLEQLRPLAGGIEIGVAVVPSSPEGVDTPEDALRAERLLREVGAK